MNPSQDPTTPAARLALEPIGADDAPRLQAVFEGAADYFTVLAGTAGPAPDAAAAELRLAAGQPGRTVALVTLPDGSEAGALGWWAAHPEPDVALLGMLVVLPAQRRQGLAREALEALGRLLRPEGITRLRTAIPYRRAAAVRGVLLALGFAEMSIAEHTRLGIGGAGISLWEKPLG